MLENFKFLAKSHSQIVISIYLLSYTRIDVPLKQNVEIGSFCAECVVSWGQVENWDLFLSDKPKERKITGICKGSMALWISFGLCNHA